MRRLWTVQLTVWASTLIASLLGVVVLARLSSGSLEFALESALADHLAAQAGVIGGHVESVPFPLLLQLDGGQGLAGVRETLIAERDAAGLHEVAALGPDGAVVGTSPAWIPRAADADLVAHAIEVGRATGPLYRASDGQLYLTAYVALPQQGWVLAVEGSAESLGAVEELRSAQAAVGFAVVVVCGLVGFALAFLVSQPLRRLEARLTAVHPGDSPDSLPAGGPREVQRVATSARRLLEAIRERDARVEAGHRQKVDELTRLAAEVAHEVRNPLNAMGLSISMIPELGERAGRERVAARLHGQIAQLEAIVERLVDLTRPLQPAFQRVDVAPVVVAVAAEVEVDVEAEVDGLELRTDPGLLSEVLRNLFLNAQQAGATSVRVTPGAGGLVIRDDGPGIAVDTVEHLFEWFYTTRAKGAGLGLPHSRRVAEALGGHLTLVERHPATFMLQLPEAP